MAEKIVLSDSNEPELSMPNPYKKLAWVLGIVATLVFFIGAVMSISEGRSMNKARNLLVTTNATLQYRLFSNVVNTCTENAKAFPSSKQATICGDVLVNDKVPALDQATGKLVWDSPKVDAVLKTFNACYADKKKPAGCDMIWRAALALERETSRIGYVMVFTRAALADTSNSEIITSSTSILLPFLLLAGGIGGLIVALGLGTKQRVAGVWIDTRNRVSLARAQVSLWTVVALSGYAALALFNIGFSGGAGIEQLSVFPNIPGSVAVALGIATVSPMISALILPTKDAATKDVSVDGAADPRKRVLPFLGAESDGLAINESPQLASIADIFMGEEKANATTVDIARLQNVVITALLVLGYFAVLLQMTDNISALSLYGANGPRFNNLPELGESFTSLLFASHATYLVAKAHDAQAPNSSERSNG